MRPCIPPEVLKAAAEAEKRRDDAIDRLLKQLAGEVPADDDFSRQMHALIDADERKDR